MKLFEALTDELAFAISFEKERQNHRQTEQGRLQAEAEKLRLAEQLNATLESVTDLIFSINRSGYITYANGGTKRLYPQYQKLEGVNARDIPNSAEAAPLAVAIEKAIVTQESQSLTYFDTTFGKWFHLRIFVTDDGVTCYARDLTEQKLAEEKLMRAQRLEAVGKLAGGIAHDFNNLLTVISGNVEILGDLIGGDVRLGQPLKGIEAATHRAAELTMRILAFSRQQDLAPERVDLAELIAEAEKMISRLIGVDIGVDLRIQNGLWPVEVDQSQFTNALINLCVNARDAMSTGGSIRIEIENVSRELLGTNYKSTDLEDRDYVRVSVIDTGTGIPPELLDKIVEPFFTTKEVGKGTGLGLSMAYGFAKQSGGDLKIQSEAGKGTSVSVFLPRMNDDQTAINTVADADIIPCGTERVLLVDDDRQVRETVASNLRSLGYIVEEASDAESALRYVQSGQHLDLLLSDIVMPGTMNGLKLAAEIRKFRPNLKTLFMSGFAEDLLAKEGLLSGSIELLDKPFRRSQIATKVRSVLDA
ncbi:MAG: response regulator [Pseudomonadota bacterium]